MGTALTASWASQMENVPQSSHSVPGRAFSSTHPQSPCSHPVPGEILQSNVPRVVNFPSLIFSLYFKRLIFDEKKKKWFSQTEQSNRKAGRNSRTPAAAHGAGGKTSHVFVCPVFILSFGCSWKSSASPPTARSYSSMLTCT